MGRKLLHVLAGDAVQLGMWVFTTGVLLGWLVLQLYLRHYVNAAMSAAWVTVSCTGQRTIKAGFSQGDEDDQHE